ncbi:DUF883 domain-containing protein [Candidatus Ornithobacterium hominis]|uniref:hypothetical protein n=1 Tax=Candidatus Ornithobacterium hominis TaxID=2497989 RepID=UPI0024BC63FD|nr:hypothetical protein [Candidatus Ornithobacterium hominis]CAI9429071.1 DUF883 domain-containing protein [Candidatus Ornithobacterium hominis]
MASNSIRNIKDLQNKKSELKNNIENGINNPLSNVTSVLFNVLNKQRKKEKFNLHNTERMQRNELMSEGIKAVLTLVASAAVSRFKLGTLSKMALTSTVAIATPYVVDLIQNKITGKR